MRITVVTGRQHSLIYRCPVLAIYRKGVCLSARHTPTVCQKDAS